MDVIIEQKTIGGVAVTEFSAKEVASDSLLFLSLPTEVCRRKDITSSEKLLFGYIASFNLNNKPAFMSNAYIARSLGFSVPLVKKLLKSLEDKNLIKRDLIKTFNSTKREQIKINIDFILPGGGYYSSRGVDTPVSRGGYPSIQGVDTRVAHTNNITYKITSKSESKKTKSKDIEVILKTYNEVWKANIKSSKAWENNYTKWLEDYTHEDILQAIKNMRQQSWIKTLSDRFTLESFFRTDKDWIGACLDLQVEENKDTRDGMGRLA